MGKKRPLADAMEPEVPPPPGPYIAMFERFRADLDEHHDRRERVTKCSRDLTAASKKAIFALQRTPALGTLEPLPAHAANVSAVLAALAAAAPDLRGPDAHRYARTISPGLQEYVEAATFAHYLATQTLLPYGEVAAGLRPLLLPPEDYVLGVYDLTGEMMRFAITAMATAGALPGRGGEGQRDILMDLRRLRAGLGALELEPGSWAAREAEKKMEVLRACVDKVEAAVYGLTIRGSERPKGWMPPVEAEAG